MNYKSVIDKISYLPNSNNYNISFKSKDINLKFILKVQVSDAKNIVLANEGIKSDRLKTYYLFLSFIDLFPIKINEIHIRKNKYNICSFINMTYNNKMHTLDLNYVDGIILSILSLSPLYMDENLFTGFIPEIKLIQNHYKIPNNNYLKELRESLKILINNEEYETAAIIRDKINKISN